MKYKFGISIKPVLEKISNITEIEFDSIYVQERGYSMFNVTRGLMDLDISLSSTFDNIDRVDEEAIKFLARKGIKEEAFSIRLAVRESLLNAVIHGCSGDPNKIIKCDIRFKDNAVLIEIDDGGNGFDWTAFMKKDLTTFPSDSGRGLIIMRKYCTDIEFNAKGSKVFLRKKIGDKIKHVKWVRRQRDIIIIKPEQDIVASIAEELRGAIEPQFKDCPSVVIIDFAGVDMVDSAGISVLLSVRFCANDSGSKLIVINASENICGVFNAVGLNKIFDLVNT